VELVDSLTRSPTSVGNFQQGNPFPTQVGDGRRVSHIIGDSPPATDNNTTHGDIKMNPSAQITEVRDTISEIDDIANYVEITFVRVEQAIRLSLGL